MESHSSQPFFFLPLLFDDYSPNPLLSLCSSLSVFLSLHPFLSAQWNTQIAIITDREPNFCENDFKIPYVAPKSVPLRPLVQHAFSHTNQSRNAFKKANELLPIWRFSCFYFNWSWFGKTIIASSGEREAQSWQHEATGDRIWFPSENKLEFPWWKLLINQDTLI